ncbi:MAG TPA: hypothetical protein VFQ65_02990 [Kofleriaceae bacterium]|nr:hypothetical protein [Kofleriaceae bacterium]
MARAFGLRIVFVIGMVIAAVMLALPIFIRSLLRGARSFHPRGTVCRADVVALDPDVGARLAGSARVRLSGSTGDENSTDQTVLGMAIALPAQDLPLATFEAFVKLADATKHTNVADYLANEFASVSPWRVRGLGIVWLRAVPSAPAPALSGTRVERLDARIAAGQATFVLEARDAPGPNAAVRARLAELRLVERLPDDPRFAISMFHTGAGFVPTGMRNGIRAVVYPVSRLARHLRGG